MAQHERLALRVDDVILLVHDDGNGNDVDRERLRPAPTGAEAARAVPTRHRWVGALVERIEERRWLVVGRERRAAGAVGVEGGVGGLPGWGGVNGREGRA